jgi:hypothetical protein
MDEWESAHFRNLGAQDAEPRPAVNWILSTDATWSRHRPLALIQAPRTSPSNRSAFSSASLLFGESETNPKASSLEIRTMLTRRASAPLISSVMFPSPSAADSDAGPRITVLKEEDYDAVFAAWKAQTHTGEE